MNRLPEPHPRPEPWRQFRHRCPNSALGPFFFIDWCCQYLAFYLGRWSFLEVLEYLGSLSILFAAILYFAETGKRLQQMHYQAWQVINTAQGRGGNGGRIEAMEELNADHVSLIGVDVSGAFLFKINLKGARLRRASFHNTDLRQAHLENAGLQDTDFRSANLRDAVVHQADFTGSDLSDSDLTSADFSNANLTDTNFDRADLRNTDFANISDYRAIKTIVLADINSIKNPPAGFVPWALAHGAVNMRDTDQWLARINAANSK